MPNEEVDLLSYEEVIEKENKCLKERRRKLFDDEAAENFEKNKFGIALSGGGIRSSTINMGFLKTLNKVGILKRADYVSTVSGGGYTGSYIQGILKDQKDYNKLFAKEHIDYMRKHGEYLVPGRNWNKRWNTLILTVGYLVSLVMSWISPLILVFLIFIPFLFLKKLDLGISESIGHILKMSEWFWFWFFLIPFVVFVTHFVINIFLSFGLGVSKKFNQIESAMVSIGLVGLLAFVIVKLAGWNLKFIENIELFGNNFQWYHWIFLGIGFILLGFYANPNAISFHRFYRHQLSEVFLHFAGDSNVRIKDLFKINLDSKNLSQDEIIHAPYPLINTCLNLQALDGTDEKFKGAKASDYFLLSPLYCGSKLAKYIPTDSFADYRNMTLPAATTISAAAVNPGMGMYSNKLLSILMTVFNARLGFWISNPLKKRSKIVWWPLYFFYELVSNTGTKNRKLNISDGGHIENLGVYELLRRKCRLIIAVDAGADPKFTFVDLENLTIRARNELGLDINFRSDQIPEEIIRPQPSHGYSRKRFAIADVYYLWEEIKLKDRENNVITFPKKDEDGNVVLNKKREPQLLDLEILINYNTLRFRLNRLNKKEREKLIALLDTLKLTENVQDVLYTLDLEKDKDVKEALEALNIHEKNILAVFGETIDLLEAIRIELIDKVKQEDHEYVFKQIVVAIENKVRNNLKMGTLVYVKSSVTAPAGKPLFENRNSMDYGTYKYKVYHPSFPHEPTSDQFFDPIQWESYYKLGQFIGTDVLGDDDLKTFEKCDIKPIEIEELIEHFDNDYPLFLPELESLPEEAATEIAEGGIIMESFIEEEEELETDAIEEIPVEKVNATRPKPQASQEDELVPPEIIVEAPVEEKVVVGDKVKYKM